MAEVAVGPKSVKASLRMLEDERLLVYQGREAQRCIVQPQDGHEVTALRVAILDYYPLEQTEQWVNTI